MCNNIECHNPEWKDCIDVKSALQALNPPSSLSGPPPVGWLCRGLHGDVEEGGVLLDDGELDLLGEVPLGEHLHRVDARQQDPPELALLRRLKPDVATVDLK